MNQQQTGLMVLRVWTEEGSAAPLRVDIRQTTDPPSGFHGTMTFSDIDLVVDTVRTFLETGASAVAVERNGSWLPRGS
ncbi:MAG: hypothetical protein WD377_01725 [Nitriliruptoraceae bacterium]